MVATTELILRYDPTKNIYKHGNLLLRDNFELNSANMILWYMYICTIYAIFVPRRFVEGDYRTGCRPSVRVFGFQMITCEWKVRLNLGLACKCIL